jgi:hypothetical protein
MSRRIVSRLALGCASLAAALMFSPPAEARGPHHWKHRHHHGGGHIAFGFDSGPPALWPAPWEQAVYAPAPMPEPVTYVAPAASMPESGRYCREYYDRAIINGKAQPTYGTACWQPDGSWEIQQ